MITYRTGTADIDWEQLTALYREVGMVGGYGEAGDTAGIRAAFEASYRVVTAWDGERLVGAGRILSDGLCYAMVFDVAVTGDYRRRGIATGIMTGLMKGNEALSFHLTSNVGIEVLYRKLGFRRHKNAFARYPAARAAYGERFLED